ncbi:T9SS type A sorting domain-containing protein [candidate division KSB1 bacterium]|nr:T9SS type A sorting domain-containing protein [candidate division KSB1 bacterium]
MRYFFSGLIILSVFMGRAKGQQGWFEQETASTTTFYSVHFVDDYTGWAVGDNGTILKTIDAGMTWSVQQSGTTHSLTSVHFATADSGWVTCANSDVVLRTTDGGTQWTGVAVGGGGMGLNSVFFINSRTGWVAGINAESHTICKTVNGGLNWQEQSWRQIPNCLQSITFIDANFGWAAGADGRLRRTINGGASWSNHYCGKSSFLHSVCFIDAQTGWIVGKSGTICKSIDGGSSWEDQTSATTAWLYDIYFADMNTGWIVGQDGLILKTSDGGDRWYVHESGTTKSLRSVFFTDALTGWAVGADGTILHTIDGGASDVISQIQLTIPSLDAFVGELISVPVNVQFPVGKEYNSVELLISGYRRGLQFVDIDVTNTLIGQAGWIFEVNEAYSLFITAHAGENNISGSGVLLQLKFRVVGEVGFFIPIVLKSAVFNANEDTVITMNGGVHIRPVPIPAKSLTIGNQFFLTETFAPDLQPMVSYNIVETVIGEKIIDDVTYAIIESRHQNGSVSRRDERSTDTQLYIGGQLIYDLNWTVGDEVWNEFIVTFSDVASIWGVNKHKLILSPDEFHEPRTEKYEYFQTFGLAYYGWITNYLGYRKDLVGAIIDGVAYGNTTGLNHEDEKEIPSFQLLKNYPNPFNDVTHIKYQLPTAATVTLSIYNLAGQRICTIVNHHQNAGHFQAAWDGKNEHGDSVPSGLYLYQLKYGDHVQTEKMLLVK